jgi:peroxiredoxin
MINKQNLQLVRTNKGNNLLDLSNQNPVLLVFLRHFGCVYCKESMMDIALKKINFEKKGVHVVMVHMAEFDVAESYMKEFSLTDIEHISDIDCKIYAMFGLVKGSFSQLFGLKTWIRGFEIAVTKQMIPSNKRVGDGFQMPGVFLIKDGEVVSSFIHKSVADKPDYEGLIQTCSI